MSDIASMNMQDGGDSDLLQALMDTIPDHIYFKDLYSRFIKVNRSMAEILNLSDPAEAAGKTDFDFFTIEHAQHAYDDEQEIIKTGKPILAKEEKETWPDGSVTWVSTTKVPLLNEEKEIIGTFGISRDITRLKEAHQAIKDSEKQKIVMESLATACHHLGQPATVLLSNLEMLCDMMKDDDQDKQRLIKDCLNAAVKNRDILLNLKHLDKYRTIEYLSGRENQSNTQLLDIEVDKNQSN